MFDVYAYDAATFARKLVFENSGFFPAAISPDGKWLALAKETTAADSDVYLADLTKPAKQTPVLVTPNDAVIAYGAYEFTPDSKQLVYGTDEFGEYTQAWTHDLASGEKKELHQGRLGRDVRHLLADRPLSRLGHQPGRLDRPHHPRPDHRANPSPSRACPPATSNSVRFNRDETKIAFTVASDTSPADVFVADLATGAANAPHHQPQPRHRRDRCSLTAKSSATRASTVSTFPPSCSSRKARAPMRQSPPSIDVHGGPGGQSRKGYTAHVPAPRQSRLSPCCASTTAARRATARPSTTWTTRSTARSISTTSSTARNTCRRSTGCRGDKIAIMGGSYGGYMVAAALAFRPEEFTAGIDIFGVTNWVRTLKSIPPWWGAQKDSLYDEMGDPGHRRRAPPRASRRCSTPPRS